MADEVKVVEADVVVKNHLGLHLRAASALAQTASRFKSSVKLSDGEEEVSARSITSIITLGAAKGTRLKVRAEGPDASEALEAVRRLFEQRFGEN